MGEIADGVIVGSRLVRAAGEAGSPEAAADAVARLPAARRASPSPGRIGAAWDWS